MAWRSSGHAQTTPPPAYRLTEGDYQRIGNRVRHNEVGSDPKEFTAWNADEKFASLGIGHFIWYPANQRQGFEESFPPLVAYLRQHGAAVPAWLQADTPCPWNTRAEFKAALDSPRLVELRGLLQQTTGLQSHFLVERLQRSLPQLEKGLSAAAAEHLRRQVGLLLESGAGTFALVDYVNFKGDGTQPGETYQGEGWGLRQVLSGMNAASAQDAPKQFGASAARVLTRRVQLSPPAHQKGDHAALPGWLNRVRTY